MRTRTIVTSQPDVACYVCGRRLLRGEQPEIFVPDGRPRIVCELCAPRAANEGWLREADGESVSVAPVRARRGRNLFGRLRQAGRPASALPSIAPPTTASYDRESEPYDFLGGSGAGTAEPLGALGEDQSGAQPPQAAPLQVRGPSSPVSALTDDPGPRAEWQDGLLERAIQIFNAGEYPRRVASLARSLGVPSVSIRPVADGGSVVAVVVAWELSWYRYGVDIDGEAGDTRVLAQGTELTELEREDRLANAVADDLGSLSLSGARV